MKPLRIAQMEAEAARRREESQSFDYMAEESQLKDIEGILENTVEY